MAALPSRFTHGQAAAAFKRDRIDPVRKGRDRRGVGSFDKGSPQRFRFDHMGEGFAVACRVIS